MDNLVTASSSVTVQQVQEALALHFTSENQNTEIPLDELSIQKHASEFRSWDWLYAKTPKFSLVLNTDCEKSSILKIDIVKGIIQSILIDEKPIDFEIKSGMKFEARTFLDIAQRLRGDEKEAVLATLQKLQLIV